MSRWARNVWNELEQQRYDSEWYRDIQELQERLGNTEQNESTTAWKRKINRIIRAKEEEKWRKEKQQNRNLKYYPKEELGSREIYLNKSKLSTTFCKWRINDLRPYKGTVKCIGCKEGDDLVKHLLTECTLLDEMREETGINNIMNEKIGQGLEETEAIKQILGDTNNMKRLKTLYEKWINQWEEEARE